MLNKKGGRGEYIYMATPDALIIIIALKISRDWLTPISPCVHKHTHLYILKSSPPPPFKMQIMQRDPERSPTASLQPNSPLRLPPRTGEKKEKKKKLKN